jgi:hypothetical protein
MIEKTAPWFDALPSLSKRRDGSSYTSSHGSSGLLWSSQIACAREAAQTERNNSHYLLARTLLDAYTHGHGPECLSESLGLLRTLHGHGSASGGLPGQAMLCHGEALFEEHLRTGAVEPLQETVRIYEQSSADETLCPSVRCQLAKALIARGAFTGENADICRAGRILDALGPVLEESSESRPEFAVVSASYHVAVWRLHRTYILPDLRLVANDLVKHLQKSHHQLRRADLLAACFSTCAIICHVTQSVKCAPGAAELAKDTLATIPRESFAVVSALNDFGERLDLYSKDKLRPYVHQSRQLIERMFEAAQGNCIYTSEAHYALGIWMLDSIYWFKTDYTTSLEVCVAQCQQALASCPPSHIHRYGYLIGLSSSLLGHYYESGSRSALNQVVALYDRYADVARGLPPLAINFAEAMLMRAQAGRLRLDSKQSLISKAAHLLKAALLVTPESSMYRTFLLHELSEIYRLETRLGGTADEEEHLAIARGSVAASIKVAADPSPLEFGLAVVLYELARQKEDPTTLDEAMTLLRQISTRPIEHDTWHLPSDASWMQAKCYMLRYKLLGIQADLQTAEEMFRASCSDFSDRLVPTLRGIVGWADAAQFAGQHAAMTLAHQEAFKMLPQIAYLGEDVTTRFEALQLVEGLACRAATLALSLDDPRGAVEALEQARGVIWSQSLHPKAAIRSIPPQHVEAFMRAAESLEKATEPNERRAHAAQLELVTGQIRQVDGCQRFLLPRLYPELKACALLGYVVLVVPSDAFTDVVVIRDTKSPPGHLRLPALKLSHLQKLVARFKKMSDRSRDSMANEPRGMKKVGVGRPQLSNPTRDTEAGYLDVLGQLWTGLVYPVVTNLKIEVRLSVRVARSDTHVVLQHSSDRPRLWWCPAGPFAELPLHAAGIYKGAGQDCLTNYAVSSYTPTLSALLEAQTATSGSDRRNSANALVVSVPEAPGLSSLPNARVESSLIQETIPSAQITALSNEQANIARVLEALPGASVLHLACHGHQSQDDPLTSGFSLRDGRLTLKRLTQLHLPRAELAYLSACETASTDEYQPDEAINLAATMLYVGFKSVIATMWYALPTCRAVYDAEQLS